MGFRGKLVVLTLCEVILIATVFFCWNSRSEERDILNIYQRLFADSMKVLSKGFIYDLAENNTLMLQRSIRAAYSNINLLKLEIYDQNGRVVAGELGNPKKNLVRNSKIFSSYTTKKTAEGRLPEKWVATVEKSEVHIKGPIQFLDQPAIGYVYGIFSTKEIKDQKTRILIQNLIILGIALVAFVFISIIFANRVTRPIQELTVATKTIQDQKKSSITAVYSQDEVGELSQSIASMVDTMNQSRQKSEESSKKQQEYLLYISHNLRTPMHAILSFSKLASMLDEVQKNSKLCAYIGKIITSGERVLRVLDQLLDLSRLESKGRKDNFAKSNINNIVLSVIDEFSSLFENKKLKIIKNLLAGDEVLCDAGKIESVVQNLLSNAIKASPLGGKIVVSSYTEFEAKKMFFVFSVEDDGDGLGVGQEGKVFEKFYHARKERSGIKSAGLGLTICKKIIREHKGKIFIKNREIVGAQVVFKIPFA